MSCDAFGWFQPQSFVDEDIWVVCIDYLIADVVGVDVFLIRDLDDILDAQGLHPLSNDGFWTAEVMCTPSQSVMIPLSSQHDESWLV